MPCWKCKITLAKSELHSPRIHSTRQNKLSSPLLRLPAELRNHIYGYVVTTPNHGLWNIPEHTYLHDALNGKFRPKFNDEQLRRRMAERAHAQRHLSLLSVCRQVHDEARLFPFEFNTFAFNSPRLFRFLAKLSQPQRNAIHGIKINFVLTTSDSLGRSSDSTCVPLRESYGHARKGEVLLGAEFLNWGQFTHALTMMPQLECISVDFEYYLPARWYRLGAVELERELGEAIERLKQCVRVEKGDRVAFRILAQVL